jgi:HAD superfamily hydrolase (TIGR01490 family)
VAAQSFAAGTALVLFDLDHTLIEGDTDVLWCEFLMAEGQLDRGSFEPRNRAMEHAYQAGTVGTAEFSAFYVSTLADRSVAEVDGLCRRFVEGAVLPILKPQALACLQRHQRRGDRVILTTATNRVLTAPTARALGLRELIATEVETLGEGSAQRYTGRPTGTLNMREGKVERLRAWLGPACGDLARAVFYSDSANDLPLLQAVGLPRVVDPDARLRRAAAQAGWPVLYWAR